MTSITSLAKFEMCRIVEHTHNTGKLLQVISLEAHREHFTTVLQNRVIRTNEYIVQFQMYILYCTDANVCIVSQTKRLEAHGARYQFRNILNMKIAEDTGGVANENYDAMIWYYYGSIFG